jgi:hypothetical protein
MKNKYFIVAVFLLISGSVFTGCEKSRENAEEKVKQSRYDGCAN